ncbi:glycosyltransferase family 4 protein [Thaumasiovibrio subtropicus]|uniref:glycosyltransferase family 4 protein n=1 Tax=Thaumasiovibrio subtropicus TaxID=1891207 RepID=UPI000B35821A|nr:glycosyltransferase family 4 protein [Thaumasiovibrio subtropicus]
MLKIVYVVNVSWFFHSHFYRLAEHNRAKGHSVHIVTGDEEKRAEYETQGFKYHNYGVTRDGTNPFSEIKVVFRLFRILKTIKPDLLHAFTIKPVLYSGLLSKIFPRLGALRSIFSVTGLGSLSLAENRRGKALWRGVEWLYRLALSRPNTTVVFENCDDRDLFIRDGIVPKSATAIVNGAGIDTEVFTPKESDNAKVVVAFVARMLKDKGAKEFIDAASLLKQRQVPVVMRMVGSVDKENISSLSVQDIEAAASKGFVDYLGHQTDIRMIYQHADIACLPSYREGLPKSLIEAASCGLPIVTTDTPGCRQLIDVKDPNGVLVPPRNAVALADAIQGLVENPKLRKVYGEQSRKMAKSKFDYHSILSSFDCIYGLTRDTNESSTNRC